MIKESQDEIMELSQPFKVIFENAVTEVSFSLHSHRFFTVQTREEIVNRNIKSKITVARGSANKQKSRKALDTMTE